MCGVPYICICNNNRGPLPFHICTSRSLSYQNGNDKFPYFHTCTPYPPSFQKSIYRSPCSHTCTRHFPSFQNGNGRFPYFHTCTQYSFGNYPFARSWSPNPSDIRIELKSFMSKLHWSFGLQLIKFGQKLKITTAKRAGNEDETRSMYEIATSLNSIATIFKKVLLCSLDGTRDILVFQSTLLKITPKPFLLLLLTKVGAYTTKCTVVSIGEPFLTTIITILSIFCDSSK